MAGADRAAGVLATQEEREALLPLLQLSALEEEGQEIASAEPAPDAELAGREMKALLDEAIGKLPEGYREVYRMRDLEEMGGDEVAAKLGISRTAMKSRLLRSREIVRQHLDLALGRHAGFGEGG